MERRKTTERQEKSLRERRRLLQKKQRQNRILRGIIRIVIGFLAVVGAVTIAKTIWQNRKGAQETAVVTEEK